MRLALHNSRLVGRELDGVLSNFHMHLVGEGDALEQLLNWSSRAGDRSKERASLSGIGSGHGL